MHRAMQQREERVKRDRKIQGGGCLFFCQAEDGIRDIGVTGVQTCALPILRDAVERERGLEPGEVAVNPEAVQLLTGHSAKGLEWDVVAVPGMTEDQFPAKPGVADSWIRDPGAVPAELRTVDRAELPQWRRPVPGSGDQAVLKQSLEEYVEEWKRFGTDEEVRLGYVAVTRARHLLVCSG